MKNKRYKREGSKKPPPKHRPQGLVDTTCKKVNGVSPSKGVGCNSYNGVGFAFGSLLLGAMG